jgi:hypothetical protein
MGFLQHSRYFAGDVLPSISNARLYFGVSDPTEFEQMIMAMRSRLRPNEARQLADWLRAYVGLSGSRPLLQKLLDEHSLPDQPENEAPLTRKLA